MEASLNLAQKKTTDCLDLKYPDLQGKTIILTGGSSGIGREAAKILLKSGANLILIGRRTQLLDQLDQIPKKKGTLTVHACDLERPNEIKSVISRIVMDNQGKIDGVVNCAGIIESKDFSETTLQEWDMVMNINLRAPMQIISMLIPFMKFTGGSIVNVSASPVPRPKQTIFSVSKACLDSLTQCAALELGGFGIRVNGVAPGITDTSLRMHQVEQRITQAQNDNLMKAAGSETPMKTINTAKNIADSIVWLLSEQSSYVNGEIICVDGGASIKTATSEIAWHLPEPVVTESLLSQGMKALNLGKFFAQK
ncbi:unnamed protein product [Blepharisma stoltei]|uniref:Ketoreductase domain-containing protein n=1 Tax=Blepharisma stoltei TaxID=1481888 RepID=A0AAU9IW37_9CILI|nr:unnamed protein product [Blepharisma stoltei]